MQPPLPRTNKAYPPSASVQVIGKRDPASTVDINRRAKEKGVIDLITRTSSGGATDTGITTNTFGGQKRSASAPLYSTQNGKRAKLSTQRTPTTRNLSSCSQTLVRNWSQGAFRWVHKGQYIPDPRVPGHNGGPQNGQLCVLKEFKTGCVYEESFFQEDIKAVNEAKNIVQAYQHVGFPTHLNQAAKPIHVNTPAVWEEIYPDSTGKKKKKLVEPMLEGEFLKFNSNSGYTSEGHDYMQALSHFSYHHSNRKHLLCDLQGGHYEDCYILTDPVIMSSGNAKQFGVTDLGSEGIQNFFAHHKCNRFCRPHWMKPYNATVSRRIPRLATTTMSRTIGKAVVDVKPPPRIFY